MYQKEARKEALLQRIQDEFRVEVRLHRHRFGSLHARHCVHRPDVAACTHIMRIYIKTCSLETTPCAGPPAAVKLVDPAPGCRISVRPWGLHGCGIPYARAPGDAEGSGLHDLAGVHMTTKPV